MSLESPTEGEANQCTQREFLKQSLLKIKDDWLTEKISLMKDEDILMKKKLRISRLYAQPIEERIRIRLQCPNLSPSLIEQIKNIIEKHTTTMDSCLDFPGTTENLSEYIHTEKEIWKELDSVSNLESLKNMSIPEFKVIVDTWNLRLKALREMQTSMNRAVDTWDEHKVRVLESLEECVKMLNAL